MTTVKIRAQFRKDTSALWAAANPVLLAGEVGYETDTKKLRIGDGVTSFITLPYVKLSTTEYQALNSILTAMGGLGAAANKLGYFTGAASMGITDLTPFARTILDDADGAAVMTTIGAQASNLKLAAIAAMTWVEGDIFVATGANTIAKVAKGAAGQLLRQNVGLTAPEYFTSDGGVVLAKKTAASSANLTFTELDNAKYNRYRILYRRLKPATAGGMLSLNFSTDGVSYDGSGGNYGHAGYYNLAGGGISPHSNASTIACRLTPNGAPTPGIIAGAYGATGFSDVYDADQTAFTTVMSEITFADTSGDLVICNSTNRRNLAQDTVAIRVSYSSGDIASGFAVLIGYSE